jgi:signal transduction histidine kinase
LEESAPDAPEQARRFVRRIREASARIERLLGELLSLATIESRGPQSFHPLDLAKLARSAVESSGRADDVEFSHEGDTRVRGDESWLARAIGNLIANALAHGASGGRIGVSLRGGSQQVEVRVENEGEVSAHVRGQLFHRFVSTRIDKGGTGLGLAIVRAVAEAHGGSVELAAPGPPKVVFAMILPAARSRTGVLLGPELEEDASVA